MTVGLELLPSPHDRLDPVAAAVRWWTSCLAETFTSRDGTVIAAVELEDNARRRLPAAVAINLPAGDIFLSRTALPPGGPDAHRKALALRLPELAPLDPASLEIAVRRLVGEGGEGAGASTADYAIVMARAEQLAALEDKARRRGARLVRFQAEGDPSVWLETRRARRARTRAHIADMLLVLALAAFAVGAAAATTRALERETEALLAADQSARRSSVEAERAARDAALASDLIARGVLQRRAGAVLADLAALNAATPDGVWWTQVRWAPEETQLAGAGAQVAEVIETLSSAADGFSVSLAGPVRTNDAGDLQTFELRAVKREVGDGG